MSFNISILSKLSYARLIMAVFTMFLGGLSVSAVAANINTSVGDEAQADGNNTTVVGYHSGANGNDASAFGAKSFATGDEATALGANSSAVAEGSIAVGSGSSSSGEDSIAIGRRTIVGSENSVALGAGSEAYEDNVVSVGNKNQQRRVINVDAGKNDTDAVNVSQMKNAKNEAIGEANQYTDTQISNNNTVINNNIEVSSNKVLSEANYYTDYKFNQITNGFERRLDKMDDRINKNDKRASAGIASVAAMANIPYMNNTQFSAGIGVGNYRDANAFAAGAQYQLRPNTNLRMSASWNTEDRAVLGAGVAVGW